MSLVKGYLKQVTASPANNQVTAKALALGVVTASAALVLPDTITVTARAGDGYWEMPLTKGSYEISAKASNGQVAKRIITIPEEDDESYLFDELIVDAGPSYAAPVGGNRPLASNTVAGLVFLDEDAEIPYAVTGMFFVLDEPALREIPNATNNKVAFQRDIEGIWQWENDSTELESASCVRPDDTDTSDPGRWILIDQSNPNAARALTTVEDKAELKAQSCSASVGIFAVRNPEAGMAKFYRSVPGDVTAADDFTVIEPDDASGRMIAWL